MNLAEIAKKRDAINICKTILIYGDAKTGKTTLAASIAKVKSIEKIFWFDIENGKDRLVTMVRNGMLTEEEAAKIILISIKDTVEQPLAFETIGTAIAGRIPMDICTAHGRNIKNCKECRDAKAETIPFDIRVLGPQHAIVLDSGSQYSDSIMHFYNEGKLQKGTSGMDTFREQGLRLVELLTEVQNARTNFIIITHRLAVVLEAGTEQIAKMDYKGATKERSIPQLGTQPFSLKVGKYFGDVVYCHTELRQHKAGSSTTYRADTITGSRTDWAIEKQLDKDKKLDLTLVPLFEGVNKS